MPFYEDSRSRVACRPVWGIRRCISAAIGAAALVMATSAAAAGCESLAALVLPHAKITAAEAVAAGAFRPAGGRGDGTAFADLPAFCRVAAALTPTPESDIKIEVWLPAASRWNGKLEAVGNGGWSGAINRRALAAGLKRGYAAASTDTGHSGGAGPWMHNREKLIDYGYRAVHEMSVEAKAVVDAFYGSSAKLAYFSGCSAGGREGLKAAERYPDDFDGIVAGSPASNATGRAAFAIWAAQNLRKNEDSYIPASKYPAIHAAALQACDALDGVRDGVIDNPRMCRFDPQVLACTSKNSDSCLLPDQVEAARKMYKPLRDARTGREISPGLEPGSELGWRTFGGKAPFRPAIGMYEFMIFNDPEWDYRTLDFAGDAEQVDAIEDGIVDAESGDLRAFAASGGKLIMYHGWADPQIPPGSSVEYYEHVVDKLGAAHVKETARLFMVPGMNHCGGGPGTNRFDALGALEQWVERAKAPDSIAAAHLTKGKVDRTRPLCPYPQTAVYRGSGSTDDAASFVCRAALDAPAAMSGGAIPIAHGSSRDSQRPEEPSERPSPRYRC